MPFSYREVRDVYDDLQKAGIVTQSLPEWSQEMNRLSGSDLYQAGLSDNFIKRASVGVDRLLEATGLPQATESLGRSVGGVFGLPEVGAAAGRAIPRGFVDFAPLLIPGLGEGYGLARLGLTGLLSGLHGYAETGSPAAGVVGGATAAALPGVAGIAERATARALEPYLPQALSKVGAFGAGQVAAAGAMGGAQVAEQGLTPGAAVTNPFTPEFVLSTAVQIAPFTALHLASKALAPLVKTREVMENAVQQQEQQTAPPVARMIPETEWTEEQRATMADASERLAKLTGQPVVEDQGQVDALREQQAITTGGQGVVGGIAIKPTDGVPRAKITGSVHHSNEDTGYRILTVDDTPENNAVLEAMGVTLEPERLLGYSTFKAGPQEIGPDGRVQFDIPASKHYASAVIDDRARNRQFLQDNVERLSKGVYTNREELLDEVRKVNTQLALRGMPNISDRKIIQWAKRFGRTEPVAVKELVQEKQREAQVEDQAIVDQQASDEFVTKMQEEWAKSEDDTTRDVALASQAEGYLGDEGLRDTTEKRFGALGQEFVTSGKLDHEFYLWNKAGRPGGFDSFTADIEKQLTNAAKAPHRVAATPETRPVIEEMASRLAKVVEGSKTTPEFRRAFSFLFNRYGTDFSKIDFDAIVDEYAEAGATKEDLAVEKELLQDVAEDPTTKRWLKEVVDGARATRPPSVNDVVPAIRVAGHIVRGTVGEEHMDILRRWLKGHPEDSDALVNFDTKENPNFFMLGNRELSREQLKDAFGVSDSQGLRRLQQAGATPRRPVAGAGWLWALGEYDPVTNLLSGKPRVAKDGTMLTSLFQNVGGEAGKPLKKEEVALLKSWVPEAFSEGKVNLKTLYQRLGEARTVLRSETYGMEGKASSAKIALDEMTHNWYELIRDHYVSSRVDAFLDAGDVESLSQLDKETQQSAVKYKQLREEVAAEPPDTSLRATSYYNQISSVDKARLKELGGRFFRVDVTLPHKAESRYGGLGGRGGAMEKPALWPPDALHEQLPNTLGWAAVNELPYSFVQEWAPHLIEQLGLKPGEKVWVVDEEQSRWGQEVQKRREEIKKGGGEPSNLDLTHATYPLLPLQHVLVLKAAVAEAAKAGVTKVVLPDAETVMMTEGHDRAVHGYSDNDIYVTEAEAKQAGQEWLDTTVPEHEARKEGSKLTVSKQGGGWTFKWLNKPEQAGGMTLHYDTTLPSALRQLTGEAGTPITLGEHKNAVPSHPYATGIDEYELNRVYDAESFDWVKQPNGTYNIYSKGRVGSPVFREPTGEPKVNASGLAFDISKAVAKFEEQGGFTMTEGSRATRLPVRAEPFAPDNPEDVATVKSWNLDRGGVGVLDAMTKSPYFSGLAKDLLNRYPNLLNKIDFSLVRSDQASVATKVGDRVHIEVSDSLLRNDEDVQHQELMHELIHGLSMHLIDDPVKAQPLEELRLRLIKALPKEERTAFDKAVKEDWIAKYHQGQVDLLDLYRDPIVGQRLYGLLNNRELLTHGFTLPEMQRYMQGVGGKKTGAWRTFTNFVKDLVGLGNRVTDNAFDEFLGHSRDLLDQGEFVMKFRDYAGRYLEGQGLAPTLAASQAQRALSLLTELKWGGTPWDVLERPGDLPVRARQAQTELPLRKMFSERGQDAKEATDILSELGHEGTHDGVAEMARAAATGETDVSDALMLLPQQVREHTFAMLNDWREVLDAVWAATSVGDLVNVADAKAVTGPVRNAMRGIDSVLKAQQVQQQSEATVRGLSAISPDAFVDRAFATRRPTEDLVGDTPEGLSLFQRWFNLMGRVARVNPTTAEFINKGFLLQPSARQMLGTAMRIMATDPEGGFSENGLKASVSALKNPKVEKAASRYVWLDQKRALDEGRGVTLLDPRTDPEVNTLFRGLTESERSAAIEIRGKYSFMKQAMDLQVRQKVAEEGIVHAAKVVLADVGGKATDALRVARLLWDVVSAPPTPETQTSLSMIQQQMKTPEGWLDLVTTTQKNLEILNQYKGWHDANPAWASAQRQQKFLVHYLVKGKLEKGQADNKKQAEAVVREAGGSLASMRLEENFKGASEDFPVLGPDSGAVAQRLADLEQNHMEWLRQKGYLSEDGWNDWQRMSAATQFAREAAYKGGGLPDFKTPARLLSQGAENLPWLRNQISWAQRQSNYWTRRLFRAYGELHLNEPEVLQNPELRDQLKSWSEALLRNDPQSVQKVNRFVSTWFMGFNPATALVNGIQTLQTLAPELTLANGGRVLDSMSRWRSAVAEVMEYGKTGLGTTTSPRRWGSPERNQFMREATRDGEVDYSQYDQDLILQEAVVTRYIDVIDGNRPQTLGQRMGKATGAFSTAAFWPFRMVEKFNHYVSLISAFDLAQDQGKTYEEAKTFAYSINRAVNYGGGAPQRPIAPFSGRDPFSRSVAMLATNMQNYNLGVIGQLGQYLREGLFKPAGLKPAEVYAARKAALHMLGVQFAAAGLLGMPFVGGAVALLNQLFPNLEIGKNIRESVAGFFRDDAENGHAWTDVAMTGLPSMLGWDFQSRLSMGNLVPGISEFNGFQPEALLGPPYSLIHSLVSGTMQLGQGKTRGTEAFMPPALKKLLATVTGGGVASDYQGRPAFKMTPGEVIGSGLGFNPKRLSDFNAASRMADASDRIAGEQEGMQRQRWGAEVLKGNFGSVRQELLARTQSDPEYDVAGAVRGVAKAAEELTFPRDLRREGVARGGPARTQFLATFGLPQGAASETDRLNFRQAVAQRLGLLQPQTQELRLAQLVDQLRIASPTATRAELSRTARRMISGGRGAPLLQDEQPLSEPPSPLVSPSF